MLSKIEYSFRSELWFICLCRGVIVDMPKTDSARRRESWRKGCDQIRVRIRVRVIILLTWA